MINTIINQFGHHSLEAFEVEKLYECMFDLKEYRSQVAERSLFFGQKPLGTYVVEINDYRVLEIDVNRDLDMIINQLNIVRNVFKYSTCPNKEVHFRDIIIVVIREFFPTATQFVSFPQNNLDMMMKTCFLISTSEVVKNRIEFFQKLFADRVDSTLTQDQVKEIVTMKQDTLHISSRIYKQLLDHFRDLNLIK